MSSHSQSHGGRFNHSRISRLKRTLESSVNPAQESVTHLVNHSFGFFSDWTVNGHCSVSSPITDTGVSVNAYSFLGNLICAGGSVTVTRVIAASGPLHYLLTVADLTDSVPEIQIEFWFSSARRVFFHIVDRKRTSFVPLSLPFSIGSLTPVVNHFNCFYLLYHWLCRRSFY
jgi:hypothetical protein